jgi:phage terminase large subunit GpA-like protein
MDAAALLPEFDAASVALAGDLLREFMAPPRRVTVTEWAEGNRRLASSESAEPGPYRVARTPYAREPQDCMSVRSAVEEVVLMWAAQTSKTTVMLNCVGASIGANPGPVMIVWPTNTVAKRNSRQRIAPLFNESTDLARKVAANRSRDKANTTLLKEFEGGILVIAGANSAADLRSTPVRDLYLDEIDNFPFDVDGEGDPSKLAEARQTTFPRRKRLRSSTPLTKGMSRIEDAYLASDRCRYHVPCPHCGAFQPLEFGADKKHGLKWDKDASGAPLPHTVRYVCAVHGCEIREHEKRTMLAAGVWVAENPGAQGGKVRGFHLSGLYSPLGWLSWRTIAAEWHAAMQALARGDVSLLRVFVNTRLAETYEEQGDKANVHELLHRAADIPLRVVQPGHYVMTIGADVQGDRVEAYVWAWGRGMRRQLVDRAVFYGDPALPESDPLSPWAQLTDYRRRPVLHASGQEVPLLACMVDSGGHHTQAVYAYARAHQAEHVHAVKGQSQSGKAIIGRPTDQDVTWRGQRLKRGVKLWPIGPDTAKAEIYGRLRVTEPGPGFVLMSKHLPPEVFDQITAERLVTRYVRGRPKLEWVKPPGRANEALDCAVYALAGAHWAGLDRWRDVDWDKWQHAIEPPTATPAAAVAPLTKPPAPSLQTRISLAGMARFSGKR